MSEEEMNRLVQAMEGQPGDLLLFAADKPVILVETAGVSDMREVVRLVNLLREGHGSVAGAVIR